MKKQRNIHIALIAFAALLVSCGGKAVEDETLATFLAGPNAPREGSTEARAVLDLVNDPSVDLVGDVGLSAQVAKNITTKRDGADGKPNTADDDKIESLGELDSIQRVGPAVWDQLSDQSRGVWRYLSPVLDFPAVKWVFLILLLVMPLASLLTWAERRQSAMMQDRLGPNRANIGPIRLKGILHFVADALKMISKEDFVPANVHKGLFALAPILALAPVLIAFAIIPFGPTVYPHNLTNQLSDYALITDPSNPMFADAIRMQVWQIDFGLIFYFAILTLANYGGTIAGWASYNKWALLGGLRSSSQMMSYEVAMGLALMGAFLIAGTLEPGAIVARGATPTWAPANPANWLWLWQPLGLILFFTAAIAETKRAPFDIPEGEPEIIGYFVEYSGMRWGMFFLAEFIEIVFISAVITSVFLGGYHFPFLDPDGLRIGGEMLAVTGADGMQHYVHHGGWFVPLQHWAVVLIQFATFGAKVVLLCWFQLMIRWTLPRFRADQLMSLGWKLLLPLALANIMVTALVLLLV